MTWSPRITALDLSLTGTGICHIRDGRIVHLSTVKTRLVGHERLAYIQDTINTWVTDTGADPHLVVVEGPSFGSQGSAYHQLAGLWWITTQRLHALGRPYAVITPQGRAKYATGKGGAAKAVVLTAAIKRFGHLVDIGDDNQADSLILASMAADRLGFPLVEMPATHRAALDAVEWPTLLIEETVAA